MNDKINRSIMENKEYKFHFDFCLNNTKLFEFNISKCNMGMRLFYMTFPSLPNLTVSESVSQKELLSNVFIDIYCVDIFLGLVKKVQSRIKGFPDFKNSEVYDIMSSLSFDK